MFSTSMHLKSKYCIFKGCNVRNTTLFSILNSSLAAFQKDGYIKNDVNYTALDNIKKSRAYLCKKHGWLNDYIKFCIKKREQAALRPDK